ncbi:hypothetical protein P6P90_09435 [Ectobacillus antri]|jgi:hypothetical protein|uniref:DUF1024 family protein n=1 Tax=Ectobacillus antri TaxID=2486280 RepID=A0ABT6H734_9BACI|nr:hypothetical protein [Ectobacillus antri]MDG4656912.1 hypothetical protein [Ectobacillus antri]MDG5754191.1 hypothetical protein [Ectobacillus antri]
MNINDNDKAIIEQALKAAAANTTDYQEIYQYESVLEKMGKKSKAQTDGFRYDYDDSSNV